MAASANIKKLPESCLYWTATWEFLLSGITLKPNVYAGCGGYSGSTKYPWMLRPFFWNQKRKYGTVLQPALLWARVPKLFAAVAVLYGVLDRKSSPLTPVLRSLVTVRVSQINSCHFCVDINSATLAKRAGSMEKVETLARWKESGLFDEKERAVLAYTEAVTYSGQQVTDDMVTRLKAFFDEDGIVELTGLIAFQNLSSKFNSALDAPSQGFCMLASEDAGHHQA